MINILALSGSLRRASINTSLLTAISGIAPEGVVVTVYPGLGALPLFNPDLEGNEPASVYEFRASIAASDGVIIASPEYAHGITGVMKNALDWVVGTSELVRKPLAVLNTAPRSSVAFEALKEVLRTVDACIVHEASLDIPVLGREQDIQGIISNSELSPLIYQVLRALVGTIRSEHSERHFSGQ